jgi:hypothetical protein
MHLLYSGNTKTEDNLVDLGVGHKLILKFLRNVAGYTLKDQIRNTVIRNELKIFSVNNRIKKNRLNWIHHVGRMEPERIPKQLMDYTPRAGIPNLF